MRYNKLVRDKIPHIIKENGGKAIYRTLNDADYLHALKTKLQEEVQEFLNAEDEGSALEELADIREVLDALVSNLDCGEVEFLDIVNDKWEARGGFNDRIFLEEVN